MPRFLSAPERSRGFLYFGKMDIGIEMEEDEGEFSGGARELGTPSHEAKKRRMLGCA